MIKENTVKSHRDFDRIIQTGARTKTAHFRLHYLPNQLGHPRIGIAVGKRNGGAVTRVRLKRQVRAMVAKCLDGLPPLDVIIVIHSDTSISEYHSNEAELLQAFATMKD